MGYHQKAASCSAIPSFSSLTSVSTEKTAVAATTPSKAKRTSSIKPSPSFSSSLSISSDKQTDQQQSLLFPLPSFCLYSKRALTNEYAPESEIVQYLAPSSSVLEERLPMFVGVLQSLFTVVNDMPFVDREHQEKDDQDEEEEEEEEDDHEYTDIEEEEEDEPQPNDKHSSVPFTIIGLNSMKLVIWDSMHDHVTDSFTHEKDLCLVIFVSAHITDAIILSNMQLLKESLSTIPSLHADAAQLGDQLIPLVKSFSSLYPTFLTSKTMTAYQVLTENEQLFQWSNVELQQQQAQSDYTTRKRVRPFEQDDSDDSATPPEKTIRLHESTSEHGELYSAEQWNHLNNSTQELVKEHHEQNSGKAVDVSKLSTKEILLAYKRIWNNLDLSKPTDAKLEPFVWQQIRQYQQRQ
ncbi:hypothetical protein MBANPS3_002204 [Mucor bainieri]